jgi:hypothetical protein
MLDSEVVIDGISMVLPKNRFRASSALVTLADKTIMAVVLLVRSIEFSTFDIHNEIASFNESIKIFLEQVT